MKVLIVGGVAGGASAAARLRRNDENSEIIMFERGGYISFANCGLPYYIGEIITDKSKLTLQTPESFYNRFRVDVRINSEVVAIDRENRKVRVKKSDGGEYEESYDKLILAPGAVPIRLSQPGFDSDRVFTLRNIPDTYQIKEFCDRQKPGTAAVIGGGYIGVEMAENLHKLGIKVHIIEAADHIIGPIDSEVAAEVQNHIRSKGVELTLGSGVESISAVGRTLTLRLTDGKTIGADMVILAIGVKPDSAIASGAGLEVNGRGGIIVDRTLKTSDPDIYAVGDAVEVTDFTTGVKAMIPLASPANKMGRIAADNICGKETAYEATQGSAVIKVFDLTVAATGASETNLKRNGIAYRKSFTYSPSNASYYPGGLPMAVKLLFAPDGSKVLGAQAVGFNGVDKRIDVIATAMRLGASVDDLTRLELCYAPPFSSAKDPVNMAGYVAENIVKGAFVPFYPEDLDGIDRNRNVLLDVRTSQEFENGTLDGAVNIPLDDLRQRLNEIPKDKTVYVFCQIGLRGYIASRILSQNGFADVRNLSGGYRLVNEMRKDRSAPTAAKSEETAGNTARPASREEKEIVVDACGLSCPGPIMSVHKAIAQAETGEVLLVRATDPAFAGDISSWCARTGNELLSSDFDGASFTVRIKKGASSCRLNQPAQGGNGKSMVVFSGDLDKAIAAFIIANGAASMGRTVNMFFTFWGLNILRKREKSRVKKDFISRMMGRMMPRGSEKLGLSRMNMGGAGPKMIRGIMKKKNILSLEDLIAQAIESGVKITACSMSMDVMGIAREELIDGIEIGGVASFLASAEESDASLFI